MKKIFITLIAVCLSITVSSCDANNGKSSEEKNCSEKNCGNDNSSEQQLQTPDLTLFGLKGNVKSVTDEIGNTYNFTKEGKLDLPESQIKRDDSGKIVSYTIDELTTEVSWDKDGNVAETNLPGQKTTFTYDFEMKDKNDPNGRLEFNLGHRGSTATVYIQNVRVEEIE